MHSMISFCYCCLFLTFAIVYELLTLSISEDYDTEISDEKKLHVELDAKIREWEKKIKVQHKNMGGIHMSSQHTVQTQKTIRTLENRLDQV